jgi:hypothetical protein
MICGTSDGGLLAIFFGRLQMSCDEAQVAYEQLCDALFEYDASTGHIMISPNGRANFTAKLENIIDQRVKAMESSNDSSSQHTNKASFCKVSTSPLTY